MPKEIKPPKDEAEYNKAKAAEAINFCSAIYPCKKCQWPTIEGYICRHCGEDDSTD